MASLKIKTLTIERSKWLRNCVSPNGKEQQPVLWDPKNDAGCPLGHFLVKCYDINKEDVGMDTIKPQNQKEKVFENTDQKYDWIHKTMSINDLPDDKEKNKEKKLIEHFNLIGIELKFID